MPVAADAKMMKGTAMARRRAPMESMPEDWVATETVIARISPTGRPSGSYYVAFL